MENLAKEVSPAEQLNDALKHYDKAARSINEWRSDIVSAINLYYQQKNVYIKQLDSNDSLELMINNVTSFLEKYIAEDSNSYISLHFDEKVKYDLREYLKKEFSVSKIIISND